MKRVLVVSPHWPPHTYPDMHRARMALPYLGEFGWKALVLHLDPAVQEGFMEPALVGTIPAGTAQWKAGAIPRIWTAAFGLGEGGWRSLISLYRLGGDIIRKEKPDLVFFSTTMCPIMLLGPLWKKKYGVPYAVDYQDPWVLDPSREQLALPGLKARLSRALDRRLEPLALRPVSQIVSVSPSYADMLRRRYRFLSPEQFTVLPFGAPEADFSVVRVQHVPQGAYPPDDGYRHWVYCGRGGKDLGFALRAFFLALAEARRQAPVTWNRLRVHFIGTQYAAAQNAPKAIERLAADCGVGDLVVEKTGRIGYLESLRCLLDAEALIVPGSEDPGYTASKIYPCILAKKPLLAVFHEGSSVCRVLRETGGGELVTFSGRETSEAVAAQISQRWFQRWPIAARTTDWKAFSRYSARAMTRTLCGVFDRSIARRMA